MTIKVVYLTWRAQPSVHRAHNQAPTGRVEGEYRASPTYQTFTVPAACLDGTACMPRYRLHGTSCMPLRTRALCPHL